MLKRNKVHDAVFFALSAGALSTSVNAQQIEEITVTATKRSESMQDIPLAVQAMGAEALEEQNIQSLNQRLEYRDFGKLFPKRDCCCLSYRSIYLVSVLTTRNRREKARAEGL